MHFPWLKDYRGPISMAIIGFSITAITLLDIFALSEDLKVVLIALGAVMMVLTIPFSTSIFDELKEKQGYAEAYQKAGDFVAKHQQVPWIAKSIEDGTIIFENTKTQQRIVASRRTFPTILTGDKVVFERKQKQDKSSSYINHLFVQHANDLSPISLTPTHLE